MDIKLRFTISGTCYIPEYSKNGTDWVCFTEDTIKDTVLVRLVEFISNETHHKVYFTDTKQLYFKNEMWCSVFLAAFKVLTKKQIVEFEFIN